MLGGDLSISIQSRPCAGSHEVQSESPALEEPAVRGEVPTVRAEQPAPGETRASLKPVRPPVMCWSGLTRSPDPGLRAD